MSCHYYITTTYECVQCERLCLLTLELRIILPPIHCSRCLHLTHPDYCFSLIWSCFHIPVCPEQHASYQTNKNINTRTHAIDISHAPGHAKSFRNRFLLTAHLVKFLGDKLVHIGIPKSDLLIGVLSSRLQLSGLSHQVSTFGMNHRDEKSFCFWGIRWWNRWGGAEVSQDIQHIMVPRLIRQPFSMSCSLVTPRQWKDDNMTSIRVQ